MSPIFGDSNTADSESVCIVMLGQVGMLSKDPRPPLHHDERLMVYDEAQQLKATMISNTEHASG